MILTIENNFSWLVAEFELNKVYEIMIFSKTNLKVKDFNINLDIDKIYNSLNNTSYIITKNSIQKTINNNLSYKKTNKDYNLFNNLEEKKCLKGEVNNTLIKTELRGYYYDKTNYFQISDYALEDYYNKKNNTYKNIIFC